MGCKAFLTPYLPHSALAEEEGHIQVRSFMGNFLVVVKALSYLLTLGKEGIPAASAGAVLNANYLMKQLMDHYDMSYNTRCMHEFVMTLDRLHRETGVSALDIAKGPIAIAEMPRRVPFGFHGNWVPSD